MHKLLAYLRHQPVIRERDGDGRLLAAGFQWTEPVEWVFMIFGTGAFLLFFYALAGGLDQRTPPGDAFIVGVGAAACVLICILFGTIERGVAFHRDGRVRARGGWFNRLDMIGGVKEHAHIASIEVTKIEQGAGVAVFTTYGGTMILSSGLSEAAARFAAVQLTIALRELRESLSSIDNFHGHRSRARARAWID